MVVWRLVGHEQQVVGVEVDCLELAIEVVAAAAVDPVSFLIWGREGAKWIVERLDFDPGHVGVVGFPGGETES